MISKAICEHYRYPGGPILDTYKLTKRLGVQRLYFGHDDASIGQGKHYRQLSTDKSPYQRTKVILLVRDIKDTIVSCYFQATRRVLCFDGNISEFVRSGQYGVRKILTFYNIWFTNQDVPKAFMAVRYEDMYKAPHEVLKRVLSFMDLNEIHDDTIHNAVEYANFRAMKRMEEKGYFKAPILRPKNVDDPESYKVRRGKVGGFSDYLSENDIAYVDGVVAEMGDRFLGA